MTTQDPESRPRRHVYDAAEIEPKWQQIWREHEAFRTPDDPELLASRPKYYVLDMFPYPSGAGLHIGHPEGYTATDVVARKRRMEGLQRPPPDGLGRLRPAGGARRGAREPAPAADHAAQHRQLQAADRASRFLVRLGARSRHVLGRLLPLDAVDLPGTPQARPRLPGGRAGLVVPGAGHRTRQRGGQGRRLRRHRRSRRAADDAAVDAPDHRLRRASAGRPRPGRLAGVRQGDAAQLDRQVPRR